MFLAELKWWLAQYPITFSKLLQRWSKTATLEEMRLTSRASSRHLLRQNLSYGHAFFITFGQFLGAGIFIVLGQASFTTGPSISISVLLAGVLAFLSTLTYAEMSNSFPVAGAGFQYVMAVFGELPAWIVGSSSAIGYMCTGGSLARDWSTQLALLSGRSTFLVKVGHINMDFVGFGIILLMTFFAIAPAINVSWINIFFKTGVLVLIIVIFSKLFPAADLKNWDDGPFFTTGNEGMIAATAIMYYAFAGKDAACFMAEEVVNAEHAVPQAIMDCSIFSTIIYILMAMSLSLSVPINDASQQYRASFVKSPFRQAFFVIGEGWLARLPTVAALVSIGTVLLIQLLVTTRLFLALARYHFLPSWLAHVDRRTSTPIALTILFGCGKAIVALLVNPLNLRKVRIGCVLLEISAVAAAVVWRRYHCYDSDYPKKWRLPGARLFLVFALSFAYGAAYHYGASWKTLICLFVAVGAISLSFFLLPQVELKGRFQVHLPPLVGSGVIFGASLLLWQNSQNNIEAVIIFLGIISGSFLVYVLYGVHVSTRHDEAVQLFKLMQEAEASVVPYGDVASVFKHLDQDDLERFQQEQR